MKLQKPKSAKTKLFISIFRGKYFDVISLPGTDFSEKITPISVPKSLSSIICNYYLLIITLE